MGAVKYVWTNKSKRESQRLVQARIHNGINIMQVLVSSFIVALNETKLISYFIVRKSSFEGWHCRFCSKQELEAYIWRHFSHFRVWLN